jgi:urease accessory protein
MLLAREILGREDQPLFAGRRVEALEVAWDEATKRRLRRETDAGTDVAVDLPRGSYLSDGAVLLDDGERIVVARRRPEAALVVRFDRTAPPARLVEEALRLGHAFGNQHVPLDVDDGGVRIPLTTSEAVARATVQALGLTAVRVEVAAVALGHQRPLAGGGAHGHGGGTHEHARPAGPPRAVGDRGPS